MGRNVKNFSIKSTGAESLQIPDVSTAQRPAGATGQIVFNSTTQTFQAYIGSAWHNISTAAGEKTLTVDTFQGDGSTTVFGNGSGNFSQSNSLQLYESFLTSRDISASILGFGFTDYDLDGDIDIIVSTTRDEPEVLLKKELITITSIYFCTKIIQITLLTLQV